jgi:transcriptional regulator EpsA
VVILSKLEQEYLLRVIESGIAVADLRQLFLWARGPLQALLPHEALLCLRFDAQRTLARLECLHGAVLAPAVLAQLCDRREGLALRLARSWEELPHEPCSAAADEPGGPLGCFADQLRRVGFDNVLVHGSVAASGEAAVFALFGLPAPVGPRQAWFLQLLLPYLHTALLRLPHGAADARAVPERPLSARETEILGWLREGKSNEEVGRLLGISALTVKNHLQRIYRLLGVSNRAHAVARSIDLRLL